MKQLLIYLFLIPFLNFSQVCETIQSNDSNLYYQTLGMGKPILIINGGPGMNSEGFSYLANELAKRNYKSIIYDQRGTGKSTLKNINSETVTMDVMVEDLENLRKHLKIERWTILGHSFGGILATYYTSKYPERIDKLIFSSSGGVNMNFTTNIEERLENNLTQTQLDSLAYYQRKITNGDHSVVTAKQSAKYLAFAYVYDKSKAPVIAERLTQVNTEINALVFNNLIEIKYDCSHAFTNFKQPVLILQGKNDIISVATASEIAKAFPTSKLVLMENCGHYGWLDAYELYFSSIVNFLNA
ncbi:alpha/beta fold hydrolase [Flavobacterium sp. J27]|uniref:alpha/beta fold hydrolase n=1 Tax=Flavobacterium sp. J27 TaxID=2060419 RepID=UPI0010323E8E|nr:alpha/beta hydrolase [Flavobacterium sp. J27]